jgi:FkbM family methyltransferase
VAAPKRCSYNCHRFTAPGWEIAWPAEARVGRRVDRVSQTKSYEASEPQAEGPTPAPLDDRRFGLRGPSPDPELETLLALSQWLDGDLEAAVYLSSLTGPMIRESFPADRREVRTIPCRSGLDLSVEVSDIFAASALHGSLQEADDFHALMSLVDPGATVIDVGANFGLYAVHAAHYAGPTGQVFAFEPLPSAHELLAGNIAANNLKRTCTAVRVAVAETSRVAQFRVASDSSFSGLKDTGRSTTTGQIDVEVIALDDFAPLARKQVDLIKIDVEGGEAAVLAGARHLLFRSPDVVVMFEFSYKNLDEEARRTLMAQLNSLMKLGFCLYERTRDASALRSITADSLVGARSENLFLFRPQSRYAERLRRALIPRRPRLNRKDRAMLRLIRAGTVLWRRCEKLGEQLKASHVAKA